MYIKMGQTLEINETFHGSEEEIKLEKKNIIVNELAFCDVRADWVYGV